jgi:valyl-tRNA synthetase
MRTQAHEIIRTWAFYTITKSLYHTDNIPWNDAMICGFVLAKPGEKISKSKGNAKLTPQGLIDAYSADYIRYWAASARLGTDTYFDQQEMQDASRRTITKLWNSSKFVLSHLVDFDNNYTPSTIIPIDRWIIEKTNQTVLEASKLLDQYEVGLARKVIDDLFWKDLCDNYIEIVKERLYQPEVHGAEARKSAQFAIYYCLINVLKMYSIYIPHETEYIYLKGFKDFEKEISIHKTLWPSINSVDSDMLRFGEQIKENIFEMRKYKSDKNLSMKADMDKFVIQGDKNYEEWFKATEKDFVACSHAIEIEYELI